MKLGLGLGLSFPRYAGGSAPTPTPTAPTNTVLPSITGTPTDGTAWDLNIGSWTGDDGNFDIAVWTVEGTPVELLARMAVTGDTADQVISGAAGKTIELRVWAKNGTAESLATSAAFGPVAAAGDAFVLGLAFQTAENDVSSNPYPITKVFGANFGAATVKTGSTAHDTDFLHPIANPNAGMGALTFGATGTTPASHSISSNTFASTQLGKGRLGASVGPGTSAIRIDVQGAGVYRLYGLFGSSAAAINVNIAVWDGDPVGTAYLHSLPATADGADATVMIDMTGAQVPVANLAASGGPLMGAYVEITVTQPYISIGRISSGAGAMQLAALALFKKA